MMGLSVVLAPKGLFGCFGEQSREFSQSLVLLGSAKIQNNETAMIMAIIQGDDNGDFVGTRTFGFTFTII